MKILNWKQIKNNNELIQKTWQKQKWDWDWISLLVSFALKWYWCFTMCHLTSFISLSNLYLKDQLIRLIKRKKKQVGPPAEQYIGNCLCLKDDWRGPILTKWTPDVFPSCNLTDLNSYKWITIKFRSLINNLVNISLKTSITNIFLGITIDWLGDLCTAKFKSYICYCLIDIQFWWSKNPTKNHFVWVECPLALDML